MASLTVGLVGSNPARVRINAIGEESDGKPLHKNFQICLHFFLVSYVEERLWWPIQSPNIGRKKKANS